MSGARPVLYRLSYSPWSHKAWWALAHHRIDVEPREHVPMIGELRLRAAAGWPRGTVTVPLLVAGGERIMSSLEIALWAERHGKGAPLVPEGREGDVRAWNDTAERIMNEGRVRSMARLIASDAALLEASPAPLRALGGVTVVTARAGTRFVAKKHGLDLGPAGVAGAGESVSVLLTTVREALDRAGGEHLLGAFSLADIAVACSLQFFSPVADRFVKIGPATRTAWTDPEIAERFAALVAWRDRTFATHWPA